jgi:beta-galactosidase GanA
VLLTLMAMSGVSRPIQAPPGVEITTRRADRQAWTYVLNHTAKSQSVTIAGTYRDLLSKSTVSGPVSIEPYGVRVLVQA